MNTIIFEDDVVSQLEPITLARPAYAITCGGYRLVDLLSECGLVEKQAIGVVRPHLQTLQRQDFANLGGELDDGPTLLMNARLVPSIEHVTELVKRTEGFRIDAGGSLAAARLPAGALVTKKTPTAEDIRQLLNSQTLRELPPIERTIPLFDYPHDVVCYHKQCMASSLQHRLERGNYQEVSDGVFAESDVALGDHLATDTTVGPIVIQRGAKIGPHCVLKGPLLIGPGAQINEHASIKDHVCLGHTTKVGGEVVASIIEPYSNKQHFGYLGHSYLGNWINLGAGTSNSDLKNTYGNIRVEYDGQRVETGTQFFGCVVGDYTKSAINTAVFTGKIVGVCSMLYGFVTRNVPSFVNYAQSFDQVTEMSADVMIETQRRMFLRREVRQRDCDVQLIRDMYRLTTAQRQKIASQPLSL